MDAREALAQIYVSHHTSKEEWADNVIARLRHLGFTIIHRDENHGPTLERAARLAKACVTGIDAARNIRAMGEKK